MKRFCIIKIEIIFFILLALAPSFFLTAEASVSKVTVVCPESVNIGRSFNAVLRAEEDTNIKAVQFKINFNNEYLSFKDGSMIQDGELSVNADNGSVDMIILFSENMTKGDIASLNFTANTGKPGSEQKISFFLEQAVDKSLNDAEIVLSDFVEISILRKTDVSGQESGSSSQKQSGNVSKGYVSKYSGVSSSSVSSKSSSKSKSKSSSSAKKNQNNSSDNKENNSVSDIKREHDWDSEEDFSQIQKRSEDIFENNDKQKYLFAGIGGTISVIAVLYCVYQAGKIRGRISESEEKKSESE